MSGPMNIYEDKAWSGLPEGVMRPGGLLLTEDLLRRSGLVPPAALLDLGCGTGAASGLLRERGFTTAGLDSSETLLREARTACPTAAFHLGDASALPFEAASFDGVLAECVLSCAGPEPILQECRRVLRPGGCLMLSDLHARTGTDGMTAAVWAEMLARYGFSVTSWTDETPALTDFVISFLMNGGSREALKGSAVLPAGNGKPGYFALTAVK